MSGVPEHRHGAHLLAAEVLELTAERDRLAAEVVRYQDERERHLLDKWGTGGLLERLEQLELLYDTRGRNMRWWAEEWAKVEAGWLDAETRCAMAEARLQAVEQRADKAERERDKAVAAGNALLDRTDPLVAELTQRIACIEAQLRDRLSAQLDATVAARTAEVLARAEEARRWEAKYDDAKGCRNAEKIRAQKAEAVLAAVMPVVRAAVRQAGTPGGPKEFEAIDAVDSAVRALPAEIREEARQ